MKKEKRNGLISVWKFIFALVIVVFHSNQFYSGNDFHFYGGFIAVEFYFIVSGFYFASSVLKEKYDKDKIGKETGLFILKKINKFFPFVFVAYILSLILQAYYSKWAMNTIANSVWNLFLLKFFGFGKVIMLGQLWYLAFMLMSMFILYPFVKKYKDNFIYLVSPIIAILGLGFLFSNYGSINHLDKVWWGLLPTGMIRSFAEINIGMILYEVYLSLRDVKYSKFGKILFTIIGEMSLLFVIALAVLTGKSHHYDMIMLLLIVIAVFVFTCLNTYDYKFLSNHFTYYLENLSFPIYANHNIFISVLYYVSFFSTITPIQKTILLILFTILFSILELICFNKIKSMHLLSRLKKYIVN